MKTWYEEQRPTSLETVNVMLTVAGKRFRCECGANVLHKTPRGTYVCNGCGTEYEGA